MKYIRLAYLIFISIGIKIISVPGNLPGSKIDTFIRVFAVRSVSKLGFPHAVNYFINPVSSIRYFEFDFVLRQLTNLSDETILDISSPRFFGIYLANANKNIKYSMINPDKKDIRETEKLKDSFQGLKNFRVREGNALSLPYKADSFDAVVSISVIEHISGNGDMKAIRQMWRVLKPGGKLIITTHIMKKSRIEYRDVDQYGLSKGKKKKYFFQRIYSRETLKSRLITAIGIEPDVVKLWGETKQGWFDDYIKRWIKKGISETVYDPWYMMRYFKEYEKVSDMPGIGIIGLLFEKRNK